MTSRGRTQVIRLGATATHYEGWCERCLDQAEPQSIGVQWLRIEGKLPLNADAGLTSCVRGHRVAVRRSSGLTSAA